MSFIDSTLLKFLSGMWVRHFIEDKTETQSNQETWPRSPAVENRWDLDFLIPIEILLLLPSSVPSPGPHPQTTDGHQPTVFLWGIGIVPSLFNYFSHNICKINAMRQSNLGNTLLVYL